MVQVPEMMLTLQEFLMLPETKPASEYIDGRVFQKPMPQGKHSTLQGELVTVINSIVKPKRIARAFPELRCTFGGRSIVPDIAVFAWERIPLDERGYVANSFELAPDWTIEILSPKQSQNQVTRNILHCLKHDCQLGWLIDPEDESVVIYPPKQQPEFFDQQNAILPVPNLVADLQLTLGDLIELMKG
ncbi:MAG: Uma2 family endonuclease [Cyanobacteria bacterium CRU_2_1]|nr:Uma2 family endonuclease [Cyanobacteria bacterium RU_5_0]NJR58455.1 Uma2 family endonuclease [Cyanobacteria bacterium CRU_2_1]